MSGDLSCWNVPRVIASLGYQTDLGRIGGQFVQNIASAASFRPVSATSHVGCVQLGLRRGLDRSRLDGGLQPAVCDPMFKLMHLSLGAFAVGLGNTIGLLPDLIGQSAVRRTHDWGCSDRVYDRGKSIGC